MVKKTNMREKQAGQCWHSRTGQGGAVRGRAGQGGTGRTGQVILAQAHEAQTYETI